MTHFFIMGVKPYSLTLVQRPLPFTGSLGKHPKSLLVILVSGFDVFGLKLSNKQYPVVFSFILRYLDKLKLGIKRSGGMHPTWLCFKQEADSYTIITSKPSGNLSTALLPQSPTTAIPVRKGFSGNHWSPITLSPFHEALRFNLTPPH